MSQNGSISTPPWHQVCTWRPPFPLMLTKVHGRWVLVVLLSQMWTLMTPEQSHFPKVTCCDEQRDATSEQGDGDSAWLKASAVSTTPGRSWPRAAAEQEESAFQPGGRTEASGNTLAPDRCYTQYVASSQLLTRARKCVFIKSYSYKALWENIFSNDNIKQFTWLHWPIHYWKTEIIYISCETTRISISD